MVMDVILIMFRIFKLMANDFTIQPKIVNHTVLQDQVQLGPIFP